MELPSYDELPVRPDGVRTAWHLFGTDNDAGLMNLLTPERVRAALALARRGAVFSLNAANDVIDPPFFDRPRLQREKQQVRGGRALNEVYFDFNPQSSSQWDALSHCSYGPDEFYNGATLDEVLAGRRLGIETWARRGIVTRGVLLDLTAGSYDPGSSHPFTVADLERARDAAGIEFRPGDVVLIRTGFLRWYATISAAQRQRISARAELAACGLEHTEAMVRYLWDSHAVAWVGDNPALEVWPMDHGEGAYPYGSLHNLLLGQYGMAIGELWALDELAADCAADGVHEFLLTAAPLHTRGGFGSTANALAIK